MGKSKGSTEARKGSFWNKRQAHWQEIWWSGLLLMTAWVSHLVRDRSWEMHARNIPQAGIADLRCWLEEHEAFVPKRSKARGYTKQRVTHAKRLALTSQNFDRFATQQLELNAATAQQLERLPGVGVVLSERIVKYRSALGGFVEKEQLFQVYGLDSTVVHAFLGRLTLEAKADLPKCLDTLSFSELLGHPLVSSADAKELLRARGRGQLTNSKFWNRLSLSNPNRRLWPSYFRYCGEDSLEHQMQLSGD